MNPTRMASLTLAISMLGMLGCAPAVPGGTPSQAPELPSLKAMSSGPVAPDQLLLDGFQTMVDGQALSVDEIRKKLPSRLSQNEAAKILVKLDLNQVEVDATFDTQQWGRGYGRGYFHRGFYGGYGYRSRFFSPGVFGSLGFYPYSSYYFPYYYSAGYYYPYTYSYANALCSPYLYGYGARFWPYTFAW